MKIKTSTLIYLLAASAVGAYYLSRSRKPNPDGALTTQASTGYGMGYGAGYGMAATGRAGEILGLWSAYRRGQSTSNPLGVKLYPKWNDSVSKYGGFDPLPKNVSKAAAAVRIGG